MSSFTSTSSASSEGIAPLTMSESFRLFDEDMQRKRGPLQIINPKTGAPIEAYTAYVARIAAAKEAEKAARQAYIKRKPVVVRITAPPTPFTRWATPAESSDAAKAARAKASELSAQAQRRRAAAAAIERAEDERREREAAEAQREAEENAALMKLLGVE